MKEFKNSRAKENSKPGVPWRIYTIKNKKNKKTYVGVIREDVICNRSEESRHLRDIMRAAELNSELEHDYNVHIKNWTEVFEVKSGRSRLVETMPEAQILRRCVIKELLDMGEDIYNNVFN